MAKEGKIPRLTLKDFNKVVSPFQLDLVALFSVMKEDILSLVQQGIDEGWQPDKLIEEIKNKF